VCDRTLLARRRWRWWRRPKLRLCSWIQSALGGDPVVLGHIGAAAGSEGAHVAADRIQLGLDIHTGGNPGIGGASRRPARVHNVANGPRRDYRAPAPGWRT